MLKSSGCFPTGKRSELNDLRSVAESSKGLLLATVQPDLKRPVHLPTGSLGSRFRPERAALSSCTLYRLIVQVQFGRIHGARRWIVHVRLGADECLAQLVEQVVVLLRGVLGREDVEAWTLQMAVRRLRRDHELAHELAHQIPAELGRDARLVFELDEDACKRERDRSFRIIRSSREKSFRPKPTFERRSDRDAANLDHKIVQLVFGPFAFHFARLFGVVEAGHVEHENVEIVVHRDRCAGVQQRIAGGRLLRVVDYVQHSGRLDRRCRVVGLTIDQKVALLLGAQLLEHLDQVVHRLLAGQTFGYLILIHIDHSHLLMLSFLFDLDDSTRMLCGTVTFVYIFICSKNLVL